MGANLQDKSARLTIDVWADVICPWCYIGEERLQKAIDRSPHADQIDVRIRTFQLDPTATTERRSTLEYLSEKYGIPIEQARAMEENAAEQAANEGLKYELDRPLSSTFDMLRLVHLGNEYGVGWEYLRAMQAELFGGNDDAFEHSTLIRLGEELGIPADEIRDVLATDRFADLVRDDHDAAIRLGARGVPFTVVGNRVGIPGATSTEQYGATIAQVWEQINE